MPTREPTPAITPDEIEDYRLHDTEGWVVVGDPAERRAHWQAVARNTLDGDRTDISLSVPVKDLALLKARAAEKGMPFQTLITAILHEYVQR